MLPALRLPLLGGVLGMIRVIVAGMVIVDYLYGWGGLGRKLLSVTSGGVVSRADGVAAGAAIVLLIFFVLADALGRLFFHGITPQTLSE